MVHITLKLQRILQNPHQKGMENANIDPKGTC